jgi:hypothetical protein
MVSTGVPSIRIFTFPWFGPLKRNKLREAVSSEMPNERISFFVEEHRIPLPNASLVSIPVQALKLKSYCVSLITLVTGVAVGMGVRVLVGLGIGVFVLVGAIVGGWKMIVAVGVAEVVGVCVAVNVGLGV